MKESNLSPKADEQVATGTLMPIASLVKHYKIGLSVFLVIAFVGLPLAWKKGKPIYSATAMVYVSDKVASILSENREQDMTMKYKLFSNQQVGTIGRYDILLLALNKLGNKRYLWQDTKESDRSAAERLQSSLVIKQVSETYLISVSLDMDKAEGLDEIVNTVVKTYIENAHEEQLLYASKERVKILYNQRDNLQGIINNKKKQVAALSQQLSVTVFVDNSANPYDLLLANSQSAYAQAQRDLMKAEAELLLIDDPKNPNSKALTAIVADIVYKDTGLNSLKGSMYEHRSELVNLISGLTPNHPAHKQMMKQLNSIEVELADAVDQFSQDVKRMLIEERRSKVTLSRTIEQDLLAQINSQKNNALWFSTHYSDALALNRDIKNLYEQLKLIEDRISFLELESKAPGFIRVESLARPPEIPTSGGRKKPAIIVIILAFILGIAVPILIDLFDRRIKTGGQTEKLLGYKPLATFAEVEQTSVFTKINPDKTRRMALALAREHSTSGKSSTLIALTSVNHQSGVTSLALDIAMDYKTMNKRAVLVEVNSLKSDQRYLSEHTQLGLVNLALDSKLLVSQVVSPADERYPDRISIGVNNLGLLSGHHELREALKRISQTYPLVILDAAPVLFAADTEFFIDLSDITLLLIAAEKTTIGEVKQAVQLLQRIDPDVVSFVVTRIPVVNGGSYYASIIKSKILEIKNSNILKNRLFNKKTSF